MGTCILGFISTAQSSPSRLQLLESYSSSAGSSKTSSSSSTFVSHQVPSLRREKCRDHMICVSLVFVFDLSQNSFTSFWPPLVSPSKEKVGTAGRERTTSTSCRVRPCRTCCSHARRRHFARRFAPNQDARSSRCSRLQMDRRHA